MDDRGGLTLHVLKKGTIASSKNVHESGSVLQLKQQKTLK
jgi:hypothetical protein